MPEEPSPDRCKIVLDDEFYSASEQEVADRSDPAPRLVLRDEDPGWVFLERTLDGRARFWRVVVLGFLCAAAVAMIAFALAKAIQPAGLCMLALVMVKIVDEWAGRRLGNE
ncbi:anti-sigma-K factor RskA [Amycolatopsis endophytica]|uniref:Anti-sigma-K factor RskA n=1 Tax=Amycolatopsis endophytica TaxID=860233 RepID=A0A853B5J1_9PSEU|nr:hypothetical protein [Amycolatopsis endophytica]NYI90075.1 anti-sigma-K factor RskA [Amycolatopsis endophytica]